MKHLDKEKFKNKETLFVLNDTIQNAEKIDKIFNHPSTICSNMDTEDYPNVIRIQRA